MMNKSLNQEMDLYPSRVRYREIGNIQKRNVLFLNVVLFLFLAIVPITYFTLDVIKQNNFDVKDSLNQEEQTLFQKYEIESVTTNPIELSDAEV